MVLSYQTMTLEIIRRPYGSLVLSFYGKNTIVDFLVTKESIYLQIIEFFYKFII